jgi:hypothetical protein
VCWRCPWARRRRRWSVRGETRPRCRGVVGGAG